MLGNIVSKWRENSIMEMESISVSRSFSKHHINDKDTYLKYLQFQTLHYRFFTNDKLFTIGIKESNICSMCKRVEDSNEHLLLECVHSRDLWEEVTRWIIDLGMVGYYLTDTQIIVGDLENDLAISSIILHTKKIIYNAKKKEKKTHIINVKYEVKTFYYQEKYRQYIKDKKTQFEKQYNLLSRLYDK